MARILITGSSDGLGLNAAKALMNEGHEIVLHARSPARARDIGEIAEHALAVVTGDLSCIEETYDMACQVNALGRMDAAILNAGVFDSEREEASTGYPRTLAVNVIAPYLLASALDKPSRLIVISSSMHRGYDAETALEDMLWRERRWVASEAYGESKLLVTMLSMALAARRPEMIVHAVDPGWVPTKMGGSSAPEHLDAGHQTQSWLAVSESEEARRSGGYWFHPQRQTPDAATCDDDYQRQLLDRLGELSAT